MLEYHYPKNQNLTAVGCSEKTPKLWLTGTFKIHSVLVNSTISTKGSKALPPQITLHSQQHSRTEGLSQVKPIPAFHIAGERTKQVLQPPTAGANFAWMWFNPWGKQFSLEVQHEASIETSLRGSPVFSPLSSRVALLSPTTNLLLSS